MTVQPKSLQDHFFFIVDSMQTKVSETKKFFDSHFTFYDTTEEKKPSLVTSSIFFTGGLLNLVLAISNLVLSHFFHFINFTNTSDACQAQCIFFHNKGISRLTKSKEHFPIQFKNSTPRLEDHKNIKRLKEATITFKNSVSNIADESLFTPARQLLSNWTQDEKTWGPSSIKQS